MSSRKRGQRTRRKGSSGAGRRGSRAGRKKATARRQPLPELVLDPPHPEHLAPPVHLDHTGRVVPDPWAVLGLEPGELDPARIQAAFRDGLLRSPPEGDPEGARLLQEARSRLVDPTQALIRALFVLRPPDADAWGLPEVELPGGQGQVARSTRLAAQAALYCLVEQELWDEGLEDVFEELGRQHRSWAHGSEDEEDEEDDEAEEAEESSPAADAEAKRESKQQMTLF